LLFLSLTVTFSPFKELSSRQEMGETVISAIYARYAPLCENIVESARLFNGSLGACRRMSDFVLERGFYRDCLPQHQEHNPYLFSPNDKINNF
jgi:hypothetical protein